MSGNINAIVEAVNGKVRLDLSVVTGRCICGMSPDEARDLASALTARAHTAELHARLTAEEAAPECSVSADRV